MFNFILEQASGQEYVPYIILWAAVIALASASFVVIIHFAKRFFLFHAIVEVYNDGKKTYKKTTFKKNGTLVEVKDLKMMPSFTGIQPKAITSDADIVQGTLVSFIMPYGDVLITYENIHAEEKKEAQKALNQVRLELPPSLKAAEDEDIKPVLLLSTDDVKDHLEKTNSLPLMPLVNRYRYKILDSKEVMVLYCGEQIYGIVISSEAVFKAVIRCDAPYAKDKLKDIDSLNHFEDDIYTLVLDTSFLSLPRFFQILDHAYQYVLCSDYEKDGMKYLLKGKLGEQRNSAILAYNEQITRMFDPVYDRAIQEARRYRAKLVRLAQLEKEKDRSYYAPRDLVYAQLDKIDEELLKAKPDTYQIQPEFRDGPYVEPPVVPVQEPLEDKLPDINQELADLYPVKPTQLSIDALIDYIMAHKDMVSLTIDISPDLHKTPTTMRFLSAYFALITQGKTAFRINIKMSDGYIKRLAKTHPNIIHVRNGIEEDWYRLTLDDTYQTYEELYAILLESYEYTKTVFYAKQQEMARVQEQA